MIRILLTFTVIPVLISVLAVLFWANSKIKSMHANYEKKLNVPVEEMEKLNRIATNLYQFSAQLQNTDNKKFLIENAIEIYTVDNALVQKYLDILKESRVLKAIKTNVGQNLNEAYETLKRLNQKTPLR
ncbi:MAG: hypothetical protein ACK4NF_05850 [Planctomycetota bacterium]